MVHSHTQLTGRAPMSSHPDESSIDVVRKATRELARTFDYAYWREKDKRAEYPWEFVNASAGGGWLGALIPEQYGGLGLGIAECGVMMQEFLPKFARGEVLMAFGVTEPTAGVDTSRIRTKADKVDGGWSAKISSASSAGIP
jgi:alkylation response protein AidB-like acyl-CoA dehydrogenase